MRSTRGSPNVTGIRTPGSGQPPKAVTQGDIAAREPITELAEILAAGLIRVLAGKSTEKRPLNGESSLDFSAIKSGHPMPLKGGGSDA
jgi:hypothetical protein